MAESLSVSTILAIYSGPEIEAKITELKVEFGNLYSQVSGAGKSGIRSIEAVRADLEAFGQAKRILSGTGSPGIIKTQAV